MDKFMKCSLFESDEKFDIKDFKFEQERVIFGGFLPNNQVKFMPVKEQYSIKFEEAALGISKKKIPLLLPIKDMAGLLEFTLDNLVSNGALEHANIFVIDDRSNEEVKKLVDTYQHVNYIRCDYDSGFNYSMIINSAVYIINSMGFKDFICWNSDMYLPDTDTLPKLIKKHRKNKPVISGTKLLYPYNDWNGNNLMESYNQKNMSIPNCPDPRGKVQYGGSGIRYVRGQINFFHARRGTSKDDFYVNVDKGVHMVTGAYTMFDMEWFISTGGFNPSFAKIFNDIDICLKASIERREVHYYGKDIFLFHEESTNHYGNGEEKVDKQFNSDIILFSRIWNVDRFNEAVGA